MVGLYQCKRKVLRWPSASYENMLDILAVNLMVIFLANNPHWPHAQKNERRRLFLIELGKSLVEPYIAIRKRMPRGERAQNVVADIRGLSREHSPASSSITSSRATTPAPPSRSVTPTSSRASTPGASSKWLVQLAEYFEARNTDKKKNSLFHLWLWEKRNCLRKQMWQMRTSRLSSTSIYYLQFMLWPNTTHFCLLFAYFRLFYV